MLFVRKTDDLTDNEIAVMQGHFDNFYQIWVGKLYSRAGVTNYIHMLGAGHIADYCYHWRNLYYQPQQGWEAFNSMLKNLFFRRTNQGGKAGNDPNNPRSRLKGIGRWLLRRTMWLCGYGKADVLEHERQQKARDVNESAAADAAAEAAGEAAAIEQYENATIQFSEMH